MKCAHCGLTYVGTGVDSKRDSYYYACNGRHNRGLLHARGRKCSAKAVSGAAIEALIWNDVETFLRHPGELLCQFEAQMREQAANYDQLLQDIASGEAMVQEKDQEKQSVIGLFRRGRISESDLDQQLDEVEAETQQIRDRLAQLQEQVSLLQTHSNSLQTAEEVLYALQRRLHERLEQPLSWEVKRQVIESLVKQIQLETLEGVDGKKAARISVIYRFGEAIGLCKTYPSRQASQVSQEEKEYMLLGTS